MNMQWPSLLNFSIHKKWHSILTHWLISMYYSDKQMKLIIYYLDRWMYNCVWNKIWIILKEIETKHRNRYEQKLLENLLKYSKLLKLYCSWWTNSNIPHLFVSCEDIISCKSQVFVVIVQEQTFLDARVMNNYRLRKLYYNAFLGTI